MRQFPVIASVVSLMCSAAACVHDSEATTSNARSSAPVDKLPAPVAPGCATAPVPMIEVESKHYKVRAPQAIEPQKLAATLDCMLERGYRSLLPDVATPPGKFGIVILPDRCAFSAHLLGGDKDGDGAETPKSFVFRKKSGGAGGEIVGFAMDPFPMAQRLFHEGWHQYLRMGIPQPPPWANEGVAEYFEAWRPDAAGIPQYYPSPGMLRRLREAIYALDPGVLRGTMQARPIGELLGLTKKQWLSDRDVNYALSWAAAAFYLQGGDQARILKFKQMLVAVRGIKPEKKTEIAKTSQTRMLAGEDPAALDAAFRKFIAATRVPGSDAFMQGYAAWDKKQYDVAFKQFTAARDADQYNERYWYYFGLAARRMEKLPDAMRAFERATALFPEYTTAYAALSKTAARLSRWDEAARGAAYVSFLSPAQGRKLNAWVAKAKQNGAKADVEVEQAE